jgi:hypothetical protein
MYQAGAKDWSLGNYFQSFASRHPYLFLPVVYHLFSEKDARKCWDTPDT